MPRLGVGYHHSQTHMARESHENFHAFECKSCKIHHMTGCEARPDAQSSLSFMDCTNECVCPSIPGSGLAPFSVETAQAKNVGQMESTLTLSKCRIAFASCRSAVAKSGARQDSCTHAWPALHTLSVQLTARLQQGCSATCISRNSEQSGQGS